MKRQLMIALLIACLLPFTVTAQEVTETAPLEGEVPVEGAAPPGEPTLESVTADPASYYGQEVTFEGVVVELVNIRSFILGEGAALDDDQVLVLNNTGQEFNIGLTRDARVRVTGTIYPAFDQGGWEQILQTPMSTVMEQPAAETESMEAAPTEEMMSTEEAALDTDMATTEEAALDTDMAATEEAGTEAEMTEEVMAEPTTVPMESEAPDTGTMAGGVSLTEYPSVLLQDRFPSHTLLVVDSLDDITFVEVTDAP